MSQQAIGEAARHTDLAALRGNPSFVWRAGQQRRLEMILRWGLPPSAQRVRRILEEGCGVGMYLKALLPYADEVYGIDVEPDYIIAAQANVPEAAIQLAVCERLPYPDNAFDLVLSHEVIEHVQDDRAAAAELVRVLRPGGRALIFAPNRLYPFETHGHYWRGVYHFGNTPLLNYLPDALRNRLAPHVRVYTAAGLRELFLGLPVWVRHHTQIFPGYDNLVVQRPRLGRWLRRATYALEQSPLTVFGISHLLVLEKSSG
ncbi:MAG TPA: class I SAM-dependent methyltransferase [Caldilineaceae bacterium]|nr:class I SAM-dependent methyltransferase [Caldilineaceae bacterium]